MKQIIITERRSDLGGGWRLQIMDDGVEISGGAFPAAEFDSLDETEASQSAFDAAFDHAYEEVYK